MHADPRQSPPWRDSPVTRFEIEIPGGCWIAELSLAPDERDNPVVRELRLRPADPAGPTPGGGITARMLREIGFGELEVEARRRLREDPMWFLEFDHIMLTDAQIRGPRSGRRPRKDPEERLFLHAMVASAYVDAFARGSRQPIVDTRSALNARGHHYSRSRVRDLVSKARSDGLLTATDAARRRAGGQLTDKAMEVLSRDGSPSD